ncbi:TonB-dependent receptor [Rufibacter immobilis]|nr:TonB-dependent receptor [Rufibacter immobilis]
MSSYYRNPAFSLLRRSVNILYVNLTIAYRFFYLPILFFVQKKPFMKNLFTRLMLIVVMCLPVHLSWGQGITTSSMNGLITDQSSEGLIGATVVATHTPTGTRYAVATGVDGRFTIPNMRVGGPYTVEVSYVGFQTQRTENIVLKLAEPFSFNTKLSQSGTELQEVVVTGTDSRSVLNAERSGSVTNISNQEIQALPTISRSINDFTRLTPQSNGTSIGGGNYRQNNITIDGSEFNNNFGIGTNLPGGSAQPISLDAIEEISVNVTPYDVRQSGFIGSAVNAVTRSGTNDFSGSVYTFFRNQNQQGSKVGPDEVILQDMDYKQYGFRVGGPIIKNKLFFFLNGEMEKTIRPGQTRFASTLDTPFGTNPNASRPTATELDNISNFLREKYGYETGPYQGYDFESESKKFLVRLDWNITDNHRFTVRYNQLESSTPSFINGTSAPGAAGNFNGSNSRTTINALAFSNSNYFQDANFYSLAAELNSNFFGGKLSNTFRGSYTNQNDPRTSQSSLFPFVDILKDNTPFTSFGYELFTYGNLRDVESYSFVDNITWFAGKHTVTGGFQLDLHETKNGFQRYGTSYYKFNSWDDFVNGARPSVYALTYSLAPGFAQAFPSFKFRQYSGYLQDEISLTDNLRLTVGLRVDLPTYPEKLAEHPIIANLTFDADRTTPGGEEKFSTATLPKSSLLWSPRLGFNWDVKGDRSVQVRGGSGIFTGRVPFVWIVSQASDAGMLQITQTLEGADAPLFDPDPNAHRPAVQPAAGTLLGSNMTFIANDFKMPQTWKSNLGVDAQLPFGIVGTLEGIYNKDLNTAIFRNVNLVAPTALNYVSKDANGNDVLYPDTRLFYPNGVGARQQYSLNRSSVIESGATGNFQPVVLDNASKGYYWSVTAKLDKRFSNGLAASVAYVRSEAKTLFDGSGDQAGSAWSGTATVNGPNTPELSYASYVVPDRFVASFSYRKEYLKYFGTSVSLFYEGSRGGRFSYTYSSDFNRDGVNSDLIYIPRDASEITFVPLTVGTGANAVTYTPQQQSDMFFRYIEQDEYLRANKGKYAERNGALLPWRNQFDFRLLQDIFVNVGGKRNTLQFSWDIFNVGNFLNSDWGIFQNINQRNILTPANASSVSNTVKPTFRLNTDRGLPATTTFRNDISISSTYYMQFGLRYIFN